MCGIFGWVVPINKAETLDRLRELTDRLQHRGPNGSGYWIGQTLDNTFQVALGHRRLAIVDLSEGGAQPKWGRENHFVVTFNGEIYNYIELRRELELRGYTFASGSDTEVLLHAYDHWGISCVDKFRGMFAFALFDVREQKLVLARDPYGKKPLYVFRIGEGLLFSSEISPMLNHPSVPKVLNTLAIREMLLNRYVPGPHTFFKGIDKVEPGSVLVWQHGSISKKRYFEPPIQSTLADIGTMGEAVEEFSNVFDEAVRIRMRSDAPFGAFLSGGIDSSAIVAKMLQYSNDPVRTFAIGFADSEHSELGYAKEVAEFFGTQHTEIFLTPEDYFAEWEAATEHRGAPVTEPADLAIAYMSKAASASVRMVLTGEGADEMFGGYPKYSAERWILNYQKLVPRWFDQIALKYLSDRLPYRLRRQKILIAALVERDSKWRRISWFGGMPKETLENLFTGVFSADEDNVDFSLNSTFCDTPLREMLLMDQLHWLPDNLLERGDRTMMAGSVEGRMPFMDKEVAKVAARMPDRLLVGRGKGKLVLRKAMENILPAKILNRPKAGFPIPIEKWFRNEFRDRLLELLKSDQSRVRLFLNSVTLDQMLDEHLEHKHDHARSLWAFASFEIFLRKFDL